MQQTNQTAHVPVLLEAVLHYLNPQAGETYLDLTAGYGGHAQAVLERTNASAVLVDRDQNAVDHLSEHFSNQLVKIKHQDFLAASRELISGGQRFDIILADLGVSSPHLNTASRGFSIQNDGPLDMRMDQSQALTADEVVNTFDQSELADIIRRYGEEPRAHKIAQAIVDHRPLHTTNDLAAVVARASRAAKPARIHPATRVFQALRIVVNDELQQLEAALPLWIELLEPDGRLAVISFHSLEDRLVKQAFYEAGGQKYDATIRVLTKNPVTAAAPEIVFNPRARSAKLRVAVKINIKQKGYLHANSGKKHFPCLQSPR